MLMTPATCSRHLRPRVLIVEDEADVCAAIADALDSAGLDAVCVQSDAEAYGALVHGQPCAALVVDVDAGPGSGGYDVARYARKADPAIRVVYVAEAASGRSIPAFGVRDSAFLEKPFRLPELVSLLRRLFDVAAPA
jgi:DNA-binding NtrC family response regulator